MKVNNTQHMVLPYIFDRNPLQAFDFIYYSTADGKEFRKKCDFIHEVANKVIDSRKKALVKEFI